MGESLAGGRNDEKVVYPSFPKSSVPAGPSGIEFVGTVAFSKLTTEIIDRPSSLNYGQAPQNTTTRKGPNRRAMSDITREEIAARIDASEARTDRKFAELLGELRAMRAEGSGDIREMRADVAGKMETIGARIETIGARIEGVERSTGGIKTTIVVTGVTVLALTAAIMAFGDQLFGLGIGAGDIADSAARKALQQQNLNAPATVLPPASGKE